MSSNYLKTAGRNIARDKIYSCINILGLALGLTCSLLILLWVQDELKMDRFHEKSERIFRVMENQAWDGKEITTSSGTPSLLAENLKKDFPEIEAASVMTFEENVLLKADNVLGKEKGRYASEDFLSVLSFPLMKGNAQTALKSLDAIVISKNLASKYFPDQDPIGKIIRIDNIDNLIVTGVLNDLPQNSSLKFDFLLSWERFLNSHQWAKRWDNNAFVNYVLLHEHADAEQLNAKIKNYLRVKTNNEKWASNKEFFLQKSSDTYLYSKFKNGKPDGGRIEYVRLFTIVAAFMLLIACINFTNLATARSVKRAKEVGVRKVAGATRYALIRQFMSESLIIAFLSLSIAIGAVILLLPQFNQITGKQLHLFLSFRGMSFVFGITLLTGLLAGAYPALFLSSLKPIVVLKGVLKFNPRATFFRKSLVVFQFCLATILITGMIIIYSQIRFIQTKNLGFDRENLVYLPLEGDLKNHYTSFKSQLLMQPGVKGVSCSWSNPLQIGNSTTGISWRGKDTTQRINFNYAAVDYDYLTTMGIQLKEGRIFSSAFGTDTMNYIINEKAVQKLGYKNPVGEELTFWGQKGTIIGVVKDYHISTLHVPIEPLILRMQRREFGGVILVKTEPGRTQEALTSIETQFRKFNPGFPFEYKFTDLEFNNYYRTETVITQLANYFAFLAIFISCLGLLGLAILTGEQRVKEIGVRKVLGASVASVAGLLASNFLNLIVIAIAIATPIAWWALNLWLENFAYRVSLEWWMFVLADVLAILIASITIGWQTIKAALVNPVKSLRSE